MCSSFLLNLRFPPPRKGHSDTSSSRRSGASPGWGLVLEGGGAVPECCGEEALGRKKLAFGRETPSLAPGKQGLTSGNPNKQEYVCHGSRATLQKAGGFGVPLRTDSCLTRYLPCCRRAAEPHGLWPGAHGVRGVAAHQPPKVPPGPWCWDLGASGRCASSLK